MPYLKESKMALLEEDAEHGMVASAYTRTHVLAVTHTNIAHTLL